MQKEPKSWAHIRGQNNRTLVKVDNNTDNSNTRNPSETNIMNSNNLLCKQISGGVCIRLTLCGLENIQNKFKHNIWFTMAQITMTSMPIMSVFINF